MIIDPARLIYQLNNTGLQSKDNPLYQLLLQMIGVLSGLNTSIGGLIDTSGGSGASIIINEILGFSPDGGGSGGGDGEMGPPGVAGAPGEDGVNGMVPYFIALAETFTIPLYKQALFSMNIDNEGILDIEGFLIEVD